jgi:hypothetical protein
MSGRSLRWLWGAALGALLLAATAGLAQAADPVVLELEAPPQVTLGQDTTVAAVLKDAAGLPVAGAQIILWAPGSFLSTGGVVELGRAVTDKQGKATFEFQARTESTATLNASFVGNSHYGSAQAAAAVEVKGSGQLYQATAGVRVPGINRWLLVGILGAVWSTYFTVMVLLVLIAREGPRTGSPYGIGGRHG